jgi:hypothetical protein
LGFIPGSSSTNRETGADPDAGENRKTHDKCRVMDHETRAREPSGGASCPLIKSEISIQ